MRRELSERELFVLDYVRKNPKQRMSDIAAGTKISNGHLTKIVDVLARKKLVIRKATKRDRRVVKVYPFEVFTSIQIDQRYQGDCAAASLAMYLGVDYDDLLVHYQDYVKCNFENGVHDSKIIKTAKKYGANLVILQGEISVDIPVLVSVPSLNLEGKYHMIYWDGHKVWDPSWGDRYNELPDTVELILVDVKYLKEGEVYWKMCTKKEDE